MSNEPLKRATPQERAQILVLWKIVNGTPDVLKNLPRWVLWRIEYRGNGEKIKVPYQTKTKAHADTTDFTTWSTFDEAVQAFNEGRYDGVGLVLGNGITGIDLDHAIDDAGNVKPWALRIIQTMNSYCEISPSGHGLHILIFGKLPNSVKHTKSMPDGGKIEVYSDKRYFTISGAVFHV